MPLTQTVWCPRRSIFTPLHVCFRVFLLLRGGETGGRINSSRMAFAVQFLCSSGTPSHLLSAPPWHFSSSHMSVKTPSWCTHTSLSHPPPPPPPLKGPWAASREFFGLSVQITQTIKTLQSAKPRLQPPGYALVNLSITLRASLPCCCPDTNTQPTQPKS